MPGGLQSHSADAVPSDDAPLPPVSACRSSPGKVVFLEEGNTDGWIATDHAVELPR